ncbi:unnamed protein product [Acanthoscelides obtectus]|uniref:Uncharacterized protein n=1 Tax=Acanthoscelides obtectus TaxID=200917 RepID=A0A9P0L7F8_ACAOB|nr:unnamed protein product [Acanthoscelides obtectus]CAK1660013.1 hypothetical protein AOBTE_LOCUS21813 [Acanthoscelides obtectus]
MRAVDNSNSCGKTEPGQPFLFGLHNLIFCIWEPDKFSGLLYNSLYHVMKYSGHCGLRTSQFLSYPALKSRNIFIFCTGDWAAPRVSKSMPRKGAITSAALITVPVTVTIMSRLTYLYRSLENVYVISFAWNTKHKSPPCRKVPGIIAIAKDRHIFLQTSSTLLESLVKTGILRPK